MYCVVCRVSRVVERPSSSPRAWDTYLEKPRTDFNQIERKRTYSHDLQFTGPWSPWPSLVCLNHKHTRDTGLRAVCTIDQPLHSISILCRTVTVLLLLSSRVQLQLILNNDGRSMVYDRGSRYGTRDRGGGGGQPVKAPPLDTGATLVAI